ncbi:hypothetical protein BDF14DRAFT_1791776 [Spinellus fusiger]|nr:hypothetical protein BDF14DRAFT_1791776 [Spinellus fusiger]
MRDKTSLSTECIESINVQSSTDIVQTRNKRFILCAHFYCHHHQRDLLNPFFYLLSSICIINKHNKDCTYRHMLLLFCWSICFIVFTSLFVHKCPFITTTQSQCGNTPHPPPALFLLYGSCYRLFVPCLPFFSFY